MVYKGFTKNLLVSNTLTCGLLLSGGDLIQQRIEKYMGYQQSHDLNRSGQHFSQSLKPVLNKKENQGKMPSASLLTNIMYFKCTHYTHIVRSIEDFASVLLEGDVQN